jgi:protein dithiol:quinone oxidoreductase
MKISSLLMGRLGFAMGAVDCALLLAFGYYLQYVQGLQPCPLCMVQRGFFFLMLVLFAAGALHGRWPVFYGGLAFLAAAGGAATASRQVWLQSLPPDKVPQCGPDLFFMLDNFPLSRTLEKLFYGSGECAAIDWKFLGLTIAGWALLWFVALGLYAAWLAFSFSKTRSTVGRI